MKTIAAVTSARSDFGHVLQVAREIRKRETLRLELLVTGSHLWPEFGMTVSEVEASGLPIAARVFFEHCGDDISGMAIAFANCASAFAAHFREHRPEIVLLLGDRYETLATGCAAVASGLSIGHISGGDITAGALDDSFRHCLTKLAHLHFPSNELSASRIRQMGEEDWRITVVGEPSLDSLPLISWLPPERLAELLGFAVEDWAPPLLVTLHSETMRLEHVEQQAHNVVDVLGRYDGLIVISAANADAGGQRINAIFRCFATNRRNTRFVESLGWTAYASLMKVGRAMLGNSSSGISEAPSFELPAVNIGARQAGRMRAANVIDVADSPEQIASGLQRALSSDFRDSLRGLRNPYGDGHCAQRIADRLEQIEVGEKLRTKRFVERQTC